MRGLKGQIANALFIVLTVAAVLCAVINFQQQSRFRLPDDGAVWSERREAGSTAIVATHVVSLGPAAKAGVRVGDRLLSINQQRIEAAHDVAKILAAISAWHKAEYRVRRGDVELTANVIVGEQPHEPTLYFQYLVGAAYLSIGLFVWFRRSSAPKATHFCILCLASFVLSAFHYTGKLNTFDKFIYWGNVTAGWLVPAIFLHFCLTFPTASRWADRWWKAVLLYLPTGACLLTLSGFAWGGLAAAVPLVEVRTLLDRMWLPLLSASYLAGAAVLHLRYAGEEGSVTGQQLKWLRNGAVLGALPFTAFYVIPFAFGSVPSGLQGTAVLSLIFVPLTWAYAIIRYRLMDVDVIFQQGYVYTMAAFAVLGVIYGLIFSLGRVEDLSPAAVLVLVLIATFVFQPIRDYLQQVLDRHVFYKDSYDYRLTLGEFAREMSSETDTNHMLDAIGERLLQTLAVRHVCFLVRCDESSEFRLDRIKGHTVFDLDGRELDLSFLSEEPDREYLFFESPKRAGGAIAELDCSYYVPCRVRGRTIAWIGISRSLKNDFLSSDDLGLLVALSGSAGIAIENARLYRSLERKVSEYERLKEFSENIVESINVGILAADLNDRVESWNSRMEDLTGIARESAVGRPLCSVLPRELAERLSVIRGHDGIHHLDKVRLPTWIHSNGNGLPSREAIVNVAVAPLFSREAAEIGRLIIFDDITDRSELERRLVQADKLSSVGLLAAGVAHEVNTPLAVISAYAQMLAKQVDGDEQKARLLEKIAKQTFRASEIVNSLLNFSRTSSLEFTDIEMGRVIREVSSLVEHQFERAGVTVRIQEAPETPAVRGNAGKLQQVFLNLFLNARDAMDGGGALDIRIGSRDTVVTVDVSDTGKGIPPEVLPRIFDPFFTTKGARKGTGLGLSVTYGIVQEHGGTIEAESHPGAGTRFHLSFPASARNAAPDRAVTLTHA